MTFQVYVPELEGKQISIYGTGSNAENVLECPKNFEVIMVVAANDIGGNFFGFQIQPLDMAFSHSDALMLAASDASVGIIMNRILKLIPDDFPVYNMRGELLNEHISAVEYLQRNLDTVADREYLDAVEAFSLAGDSEKLLLSTYKDIASCIFPVTKLYFDFIQLQSQPQDVLLFASRDGFF